MNQTTLYEKGALVMVAGRPGMGKTSLALDIACHLAKNSEANIWVISLEESKESLMARLQRKNNIYAEYHNLLICDKPLSSVKASEVLCAGTEKLGGIIIDYLQLISHTGQPSKDSVTWELKCMAKRLNVPVICTSQISAACETREDKRPTLRDFRRDKAIDLDFDQVLFLYRDRYYNSATPLGDKAECIIVRNRYGACRTVTLMWNPQRLQFSALEDN
jgi:replicative DNA helicase